jgi:Ca2+-binding RTX toxin-like protein
MGDRQKARRRHIERSRWTVALATSIALVTLWLGPAARAASCNTSGGGATLNITIASGQSVNVRINAANTILVDGGGLSDDNCGGNNAGTIATIDVNGAAGNETLTINNSGGGGAFDDDDDFNINLSSGTDSLVIIGDSTADTITFTPFASNGSDITQTGVESFTVFGGAGDDIVNGGTFAAGLTFNGGAGNDQLTGGSGNDTLNAGDGNDTVNGGSGTDLLTYANTVAGVTVSLATTTAQNTVGSGTDTIAGIENLTGTPANDSLTGSSTANTIVGGTGDDLIAGGEGDDSLNGMEGVDTVSYSASSVPVAINLSVGSAQNTGAGVDLISNVENAIGGSGSDTLTGTAAANTLTGGLGNDALTGGDGDDRLDGGDGRDRVVYASAAAGVSVNLATNTATGQGSDVLTSIENATGSPFADSITGSAVANSIKGGAGDDTLGGAGGGDRIEGGDGSDQLGGGAGVDRLLGGRGNDRGDTGGGNDLWKGGAGRDHIQGGAGRDAVRGGEGADILGGGPGNDHLNGGPGHDRCAGGPGNDTEVNCED